MEQEATETRDSKLGELIEKANVGAIMLSALEHRSTTGAERELQTEFGIAENVIPLAMLETRAAGDPAAIPAAGSRPATGAPIVPFVFPDGASAFMGVSQPTVPTGDRTYTVMAKQGTVGTPAKAASQAITDGTGAFVGTSLTPSRIQAAFVYNREDAATLPGLDSALRANLSETLSDKLDERVIAGLIAGGKAVDATAAVVSFTVLNENLYASVDGRYASSPSAVRVLFGDTVYQIAADAYRGMTADNETGLKRIMGESGGARMSAHVPTAASSKQKALFRVGTRMDAVAPVWQGVTLIPDSVTKAATGQIVLTAVMLYAFAVLRSDAVRVVEFKTA